MLRISEAVKRGIQKKPLYERKGKSDSPQSLPSVVPPSPIRISEIFKKQKLVASKNVDSQLYRDSLGLIKEIIEKKQRSESFEVKEAVDILEKLINHLDNSHNGMFMELVLMGSTIEPEFSYVYTHSVHVCLLSLMLGKALNKSKFELTNLGLGAFLHDVGMADVPQEIISKPNKLTLKEMDIVRTHTLKGYEWLRKTGDIEELVSHIVLQHHEKVNGQGYPKGLNGNEIVSYAKILRLTDSYEALISLRPWRKPFSPEGAVIEILDKEINFYESSLLKLFLRVISIYPVGNWVELNTREVGRVVKINDRFPLYPVVEVLFDPDGVNLERPKLVNLAEHSLMYIEKSCKNT
ncbi:MAG: HD domain-containing protein [Candidatus Omnitrophica bacterium]|nr:HD domain-containing protein [Candidatus Omnitrophota bacterium]